MCSKNWPVCPHEYSTFRLRVVKTKNKVITIANWEKGKYL